MKKIVLILVVLVIAIIASCASVTIKEGTTEIKEREFYDKYMWGGSVTIPEGVTKIGKEAFQSTYIARLTLPGSLKEIGENAFSSNNLKSLTIPEGVEIIGEFAFSGNNLKSLTLPESLKRIERYAFFSHNLTSVTIPAGVEFIGSGAFSRGDKQSIETIIFNGYNGSLIIENYALDTKVDINKLKRYFEANNRQTGTYKWEKAFSSWSEDNYYFNDQFIPFEVVLTYEKEEERKVKQQVEATNYAVMLVQATYNNDYFKRIESSYNRNFLVGGTGILEIDNKPASYYVIAERTENQYNLVNSKEILYYLTPGLHDLKVSYRQQGSNFKEVIYTSANGTITLNFEAGKVYRLRSTEKGDKIEYSLNEVAKR